MDTDTRPKKKVFVNPVIFVVGLVSFFTDMSSQMIVPILPVFLTSVLGVQVAAVGLIEGIGESTASILKLYSGWLSDRLGHYKWLMVAGYGLSNLIKPLFAVSANWGTVLAIRFSDRVGKGIRTAPRDAFLANTTTKEERGKAFGFRRSMDALGAALGPLLAFAVLSYFSGAYRLVFWLSAFPGVLAVILLMFFLRDKKPDALSKNPKALPKIGFKDLDRRFMWFTLIYTLFTVGNFSDAFLVLRAQHAGIATAWIPLTYFSYNLVASVFSTPIGMLSDRVGRRPVIIFGFLVFSAIYLAFGLVNSTFWMWILFIIYGLYYAATDGIQKAFVADLVPEGKRGVAMGTFNAFTGIAALPASLIAGFLWQSFGPLAAFGFGSALGVIAAICMLLFRL